MKIYIGPYARAWSVWWVEEAYVEWHHGKSAWNIAKSEYTLSDKLVESICNGINICLNGTINKVISFFTRQVKVKIYPYDCWNGDWTLAQIIYPWLLQFKKDNKHTNPTPEELDAMIFAFQEIAEERSDGIDFHSGNSDIQWKSVDNDLAAEYSHCVQMTEGPNHTYKFDKEGYIEYQKKIQAGLDLFGNNFQSLWN